MDLCHLVNYKFDTQILKIDLLPTCQGDTIKEINLRYFQKLLKEQWEFDLAYIPEGSNYEEEKFLLIISRDANEVSIVNHSASLFIQGIQPAIGKEVLLRQGDRLEFAGMCFRVQV